MSDALARVQERITKLEGQIEEVEDKGDDFSKRRELLMREELVQLRKKLVQLRKKELLMQPQEATVAGGGAGAGSMEKVVEEAVLRALKKAKSDQVSISAFSMGHWDRMSQKLGMKLELCLADQLAVAVDEGPANTFYWDATSSEPSQADRYTPHLKSLFPRVGSRSHPLMWLEAGKDCKHLLDLEGFETILHYSRITGNTDAVIITKASEEAMCPRDGLCVLFELEKTVTNSSVFQAACQLVVAAVLSPQWQPVVVLTDLADHWQLFWVDGPLLKHARLPSQRAAVAVISACIEQAAEKADSKTHAALPLPAILAGRETADLEGKVRAATVQKGLAAMNPDLLDLEGMLPAEEMRGIHAHMLLHQLSALPIFSTTQRDKGVPSMYT